MFDIMMTDRVTLIKKDGRRFENLKASVQPKLILTNDANLPIEDGDVFERKLPSGVVESFDILDAGFFHAMAGMPAHYQSKVQKSTAKSLSMPGGSQVIYNVTGPNARVNIQSTDSSTNVVNVESTLLFQNLRSAIQASISDSELRMMLMSQVEGMEKAAGTRTFADRYRDFIGLAADHMSVFSPFLPALTQLLMDVGQKLS
jgi:hypothetical protein